MKKRPVAAHDVLQNKIAEHDAHQKRDHHDISVLEGRLDEHHDKRRADPHHRSVSSLRDEDHRFVHEVGLKLIVEHLEVENLPRGKLAYVLIRKFLYFNNSFHAHIIPFFAHILKHI